jgi:multicomponent Na+:H+ antiporter subunit C
MSVNLTLLIVMGALYACGIYLILERSLTRVLLGLMLLTNATNLLILTTGGYAGLAPFFNKATGADEYADPLPQALILTSIVISFAVTAFMLGIIYRTWVLARQNEIQDAAWPRPPASMPRTTPRSRRRPRSFPSRCSVATAAEFPITQSLRGPVTP